MISISVYIKMNWEKVAKCFRGCYSVNLFICRWLDLCIICRL